MRRVHASLGALVVIGAAVALALRFLDHSPHELDPRSVAASEGADSSANARSSGNPKSSAGSSDSVSDESRAVPIRTSDADERLDPPDLATMRELQRTGRGLYFGVVTDPQGAPCPDAGIFHLGEAVARSDELGRYRVEVARTTTFANRNEQGQIYLVAAKPGVGMAIEAPFALARRLDFHLARGSRFAGRVVERVTRRPVANARIELLPFFEWRQIWAHALFRAECMSDARGAFEFAGLPRCSLEVRTSASDLRSEGWVGYDMTSGADRPEVELALESTIRVRGRFDPWPPPDVEASRLRVVAPPRPWRESGPEEATPSSAVAADGSFALGITRTLELNLVLEDGRGALWREQRSVDPDAAEIDLGRIEMPAPAALVGRVDLPRDVLELGFTVSIQVPLGGTARSYDFEVARDGSFEARPLPRGSAQMQLGLDDFRVRYVRSSTDLWRWLELEPGATLDVGALAPAGMLLCGRVLDERRRPAARASVSAWFPMPGRSESLACDGEADAAGLFLLEGDESMFPLDPDGSGRLRGHIQANGFTGASDLEVLAPPLDARALRRDLLVTPRFVQKGRLLSAEGTALTGWNVDWYAQIPDGFDASMQFVGRSTTTTSDGSFEFDGLLEGDYFVSVTAPDWRSTSLGTLHTSATPLELRLPKR